MMNSMNVLDVLIGARDILNSPESWCQGRSGKHKDGKSQYCLHNAINLSAPKVGGGRRLVFEETIDLLGGSPNIIHFNDSPDTSHKDIIVLLDKTITQVRTHNS